MAQQHVVVVGGGVIGAACAYYLTQHGCQVTIVDRKQFGKACSHANCGLIAVSHVLPLTEPGAVQKSLKAMLRSDSPFYIKPRFDLSLWSWLWKFARRCNETDMLQSADARSLLLNSSNQLYAELLAEESMPCEWEQQGCLFVYRSQKQFDKYAQTDTLLTERFGLPAERLDGQQLVAREPALKPGLAGGWHYQMDSHLRPDSLMRAWRQVLEKRGVRIVENCEVHGFQAEANAARAVRTSTGEISADQFVVATGAWAPMLQKELGCPIPIQPGKGYSLTMPRPARCPSVPIIFQEHKVVVTPMQSGYRIGSTMEFVGYDESINPARLDVLRRGAAEYLHEPECEPLQETWFGWRPMTTDGLPLIDFSPRWRNVLIAAGHNMLGLSMAPATGRLVSEMMRGHSTHLDPAPYSVGRF